jgi:glutamyl-tRNA synthetase
MNSNKMVKTRMAPSPTGELHVGSLGIALKNYAWAKKNNGHFILRIEDTDQTREVAGATDRLKEIFKTFGLVWDEGPDVGGPNGPYIQSHRLSLYRERAEELVESGNAYYCFCSQERLEKVRQEMIEKKLPPKYDRHCRNISGEEAKARVSSGESHVIRLKVPDNQEVKFNDLLRGEIIFNSDTVDDQVLIKSDNFPTYHLAVVVDDYEMEITHVFRGEEWISSTPKHILLYHAFGWELPVFCHFPVYLNPDGKGKMSKRKGTVSAQSFLDRGYLPEALLNFLMILGWSPENEEEIMDLDRYIAEFDPADVSMKSVVFDLKKLDWINGIYIRKLSTEELEKKLASFLPPDFPNERMPEILPLVAERLVTLADIEELTSFFYRDIKVDDQQLLKKSNPEEVKSQLKATITALKQLKVWNAAIIESAVRELQEENSWKRSQYFMMLRVAATGKTATPPLFETLAVIGKEKVLQRYQHSMEKP